MYLLKHILELLTVLNTSNIGKLFIVSHKWLYVVNAQPNRTLMAVWKCYHPNFGTGSSYAGDTYVFQHFNELKLHLKTVHCFIGFRYKLTQKYLVEKIIDFTLLESTLIRNKLLISPNMHTPTIKTVEPPMLPHYGVLVGGGGGGMSRKGGLGESS